MAISKPNRCPVHESVVLVAVIGFCVFANVNGSTQKDIEEHAVQRAFMEDALVAPAVSIYREWLEKPAGLNLIPEVEELVRFIGSQVAKDPDFVYEDLDKEIFRLREIEIFRFREELVNDSLKEWLTNPEMRSIDTYAGYWVFEMNEKDLSTTWYKAHSFFVIEKNSKSLNYQFTHSEASFDCTELVHTRPSVRDGEVITEFAGTCDHNIDEKLYPNALDLKITTAITTDVSLGTGSATVNRKKTWRNEPASWILKETMPCVEGKWSTSVSLDVLVTVKYRKKSGAQVNSIFRYKTRGIQPHRDVEIRSCTLDQE